MKELLRTSDPVTLQVADMVLREAGILPLLVDQHVSAIEGAIGAFPRRMLVHDDWEGKARRILTQAGLGHELRDADKA
jgi:hypothetical protein